MPFFTFNGSHKKNHFVPDSVVDFIEKRAVKQRKNLVYVAFFSGVLLGGFLFSSYFLILYLG